MEQKCRFLSSKAGEDAEAGLIVPEVNAWSRCLAITDYFNAFLKDYFELKGDVLLTRQIIQKYSWYKYR